MTSKLILKGADIMESITSLISDLVSAWIQDRDGGHAISIVYFELLRRDYDIGKVDNSEVRYRNK